MYAFIIAFPGGAETLEKGDDDVVEYLGKSSVCVRGGSGRGRLVSCLLPP